MSGSHDHKMDFLSPNVTTAPNTTIATTPGHAPGTVYPQYVGYICCLIAVIFYGSNFVPVKKYSTGDGMFFQWVLCSGIFLESVVIQLVQQSEFYPIVMLGGMTWATGNLCVVPVFKTIGMGLGMSLWGTCSLLVGWASGKFGWFGNDVDNISKPGMNYAGAGLAFASIILYLFVKSDDGASFDQEIDVSDEEARLVGNSRGSINESSRTSPSYQSSTDVLVFNKTINDAMNKSEDEEADERMAIEDWSPTSKRMLGAILSLLSGICYGLNFAPAIHVMDEDKINHSQNGLDYVFAHCTGIYITSSVFFYGYCAYNKNKPKVYPKVILPGIISGVMWAIATSCWYIANATLQEAVTFPIITTGPAAIASLVWGVLVFKEIQGKRNILILLGAFCVMSAGAVLSGLSK